MLSPFSKLIHCEVATELELSTLCSLAAQEDYHTVPLHMSTCKPLFTPKPVIYAVGKGPLNPPRRSL